MATHLEEKVHGHDTYKNTEKIIEKLEEINNSDLSMDQIQLLERVNLTVNFLKDALDKVDPWLISTETLNSMNHCIANILSSLINFNNDRNTEYLNNIHKYYLEPLLPLFPQILVIKTPDEIEGVKNSVIKFRQSVGQYLSHLEKDITDNSTAFNKNTDKLNELTASIENQKTRIDEIINAFQGQFSQGQQQRTDEFNNFIKLIEKEFKDFNSDNAITFEQIIDSQQQEFKSLNLGFEGQVETQENTFNTLIEIIKKNSQTEFEKIKDMNREAEKILGLMSMKGLAQGYQKIANREGWQALGWNLASVISLIVVLILGYKFIINYQGVIAWTTLVSRFVITGIGLTLFTYCSKQATNHRTVEQHNRKMELELASLEPYLKDFDQEEQIKVKQNLVNKYFGVDLHIQAPTGKQKEIVTQQRMIESIMDNPQLMQTLAEKLIKLIPEK